MLKYLKKLKVHRQSFYFLDASLKLSMTDPPHHSGAHSTSLECKLSRRISRFFGGFAPSRMTRKDEALRARHSDPVFCTQWTAGRIPCPMENHGFTMVELLTALLVFGIMTLALYMVFDETSLIWRNGESKTEQHQNARNALDLMSREIAKAVIGVGGPSASPRPYMLATNGQKTVGASTYDQDSIFFIAPKVYELYEVGYYISDQSTDDESDDILTRAYTSAGATDFTIDSSADLTSQDDIAFRVTDFNLYFLYWDPSTGNYNETDEWDSRTLSQGNTTAGNTYDDGHLPDFMEITLRVVDQETLDRNSGTSPDIERKEFKTVVPLGNKSYANN